MRTVTIKNTTSQFNSIIKISGKEQQARIRTAQQQAVMKALKTHQHSGFYNNRARVSGQSKEDEEKDRRYKELVSWGQNAETKKQALLEEENQAREKR